MEWRILSVVTVLISFFIFSLASLLLCVLFLLLISLTCLVFCSFFLLLLFFILLCLPFFFLSPVLLNYLLLLVFWLTTSYFSLDYYCEQPVDVVVLLDSSSYFGAENFAALKTFANSFVTFFELDRNGLTPFVGFLPYSNTVSKDKMINFRYSTRIARVSAKINKMDFEGGRGSRMDIALKYARESFFINNMGSRSWVPHVVLAITGSTRYWDQGLKGTIKNEARTMRAQGINLVVASIGGTSVADRTDLESMVATKDDLFLVRYPYGLLQMTEKIVRNICPTPSKFFKF